MAEKVPSLADEELLSPQPSHKLLVLAAPLRVHNQTDLTLVLRHVPTLMPWRVRGLSQKSPTQIFGKFPAPWRILMDFLRLKGSLWSQNFNIGSLWGQNFRSTACRIPEEKLHMGNKGIDPFRRKRIVKCRGRQNSRTSRKSQHVAVSDVVGIPLYTYHHYPRITS